MSDASDRIDASTKRILDGLDSLIARIKAGAQQAETYSQRMRAAGATTELMQIAPVLGDVVKERLRQITEKGYTPEHDDKHVRGELCAAAIAYAEMTDDPEGADEDWPFAGLPPKGEYRDNLIKAAALLLAEIERIDRAKAKE